MTFKIHNLLAENTWGTLLSLNIIIFVAKEIQMAIVELHLSQGHLKCHKYGVLNEISLLQLLSPWGRHLDDILDFPYQCYYGQGDSNSYCWPPLYKRNLRRLLMCNLKGICRKSSYICSIVCFIPRYIYTIYRCR